MSADPTLLSQVQASDEREMRVRVSIPKSRNRGQAKAADAPARAPKTKYDWHAGRRGEFLMPQGGSSINSGVSVEFDSMGDVFQELYRGGRLVGQALEDAKGKYERLKV